MENNEPNFLAIRGFGIWRAGKMLKSMTQHGSMKSGTHYFKYFKPASSIPLEIFNKGEYYGFQGIHTPSEFLDYCYINVPSVVGLIKHFGKVRMYKRTYISSHMLILHLWVTRFIYANLKLEFENRYQCDVSLYNESEVMDYAAWPTRAGF